MANNSLVFQVPAVVAPAPIPGVVAPKNVLHCCLDSLGRDLYRKVISAVTILFDENSKNINLLQSQLVRRSENSGWNSGTGDILTLSDGDGVDRDVLTEYGCVSETQIRV